MPTLRIGLLIESLLRHHKPRRCGACALLWVLRLSVLLLQDDIKHLHDEALLRLGQCADAFEMLQFPW